MNKSKMDPTLEALNAALDRRGMRNPTESAKAGVRAAMAIAAARMRGWLRELTSKFAGAEFTASDAAALWGCEVPAARRRLHRLAEINACAVLRNEGPAAYWQITKLSR